ncbi:hypothetical protein LMK08_05915 [Metapseudomonas furukawaii]|uniref:hypothetical protein n=1 Tax=Metapseudomonas furukawaii TaxID=1149133 RepID=UPI00227B5AA8|nr:hypothetical protein [Pseudomonas furukawaii]WAG80204.1 hypothetical protein LMK08_05915 [Pseudomonas furukawaii]
MKKKSKLCLLLIAGAFAAAYLGIITRPLPPPLALHQLCTTTYQPCYMPVPTFASLLP